MPDILKSIIVPLRAAFLLVVSHAIIIIVHLVMLAIDRPREEVHLDSNYLNVFKYLESPQFLYNLVCNLWIGIMGHCWSVHFQSSLELGDLLGRGRLPKHPRFSLSMVHV